MRSHYQGMLVGGDGHGEQISHSTPLLNRIAHEGEWGVYLYTDETPLTATFETYSYYPMSLNFGACREEIGFFVLNRNRDAKDMLHVIFQDACQAINSLSGLQELTVRDVFDFIYRVVANRGFPDAPPQAEGEQYHRSQCVVPQEEIYGNDMPGMTLDEFQLWSDALIKETRAME